MEYKEKQVEEITNTICESCNRRMGFCFYTKQHCEQVIEDATALYNAGYRKIPQDSVVLSREEFEELAIQYKHWEKLAIEDMLTQASKETAEKFLQLAYDRCLEKSFIKKVEELAKQFGVEIEE